MDAVEAVDSLEGLLCGRGHEEGAVVEGVVLTRAAVDFNHLHFLVSHTGDHTLVRGLVPVRRAREGKCGAVCLVIWCSGFTISSPDCMCFGLRAHIYPNTCDRIVPILYSHDGVQCANVNQD